MTLLDWMSNEAWNQYVQSGFTWSMLGNGVSGVVWSRFNHKDLEISTRKQAGYCQMLQPLEMCEFLCGCVITFHIIEWSSVHMVVPAWHREKEMCDFFVRFKYVWALETSEVWLYLQGSYTINSFVLSLPLHVPLSFIGLWLTSKAHYWFCM